MRNLIVLVGQTASGKSDLAVEMAKKLQERGEKTVIFSLDSRQVYKDLNLGSGKVEGGWLNTKEGWENLFKNFEEVFFYEDVPHFLIDFVEPEKRFNLFDFVKNFIETEKKMPKEVENIILIGGTGMYATAIINKYPFDQTVKRDEKYEKFEKKLEKLSLKQIKEIAEKLKVKIVKNESENGNKQRIINKILTQTFSVNHPPLIYPEFKKVLVFEKEVEPKILEEKILKRLKDRVKQGMAEEVLNLNLGLNRLLELGLEYRIVGLYLYGLLKEGEWENLLFTEIKNYAKRQKTWNKKYIKGEKIKDLEGVLKIL